MKLYTNVPTSIRKGKHYDPAYIIYNVCHLKYRFSDDALVTYYGVFDDYPEVMPYRKFSYSWMCKMYIAKSNLSKSLFRNLWIRFVYAETLNSVVIYRKEGENEYTLWARIENASLENLYNEVLPF